MNVHIRRVCAHACFEYTYSSDIRTRECPSWIRVTVCVCVYVYRRIRVYVFGGNGHAVVQRHFKASDPATLLFSHLVPEHRHFAFSLSLPISPSLSPTALSPGCPPGAAVACSVIKVPLELLSKQIQSGQCSNLGSAFRKVFLSPSSGITFFYSWLAVLIRDIPRGALQYAIIHTLERLPWLEALGIPLFFQRLIWAAVAAGFVAIVTTPFDVISSKIMTGMQEQMRRGRSFLEARVGSEFRFRLRKPRGLTVAIDVIREVYRQKGLRGFWSGCVLRAAYYVPGTCIQYATFETLAALLGNWL